MTVSPGTIYIYAVEVTLLAETGMIDKRREWLAAMQKMKGRSIMAASVPQHQTCGAQRLFSSNTGGSPPHKNEPTASPVGHHVKDWLQLRAIAPVQIISSSDLETEI
ncbi:hypothetical protein B566_EDAN009664 [Ephemera danica]|nr:hypothetical protein B566_EDAN009664 [Ephemera danica]